MIYDTEPCLAMHCDTVLCGAMHCVALLTKPRRVGIMPTLIFIKDLR